MEGDLNPSPAPLVALCARLGISAAELAAVEAADELSHTFTVAANDAGQLDPEVVRAFVDHFGDAARVEVRTGELTELVIAVGVTDSAVVTFAADAASGGPYEVDVTVDKTQLAPRLAGTTARREVRLFLFAEGLRRALGRGITRFEREVWPHAPLPLVVAVGDCDIELSGPHLAVFGGSSLPRVADAAAATITDPRFPAVIAARDRHVGWDTAWVQSLTPWHFDITGGCADAELRSALRAQLMKLAVLFTCDRARAQPTGLPPSIIRAEYRGREHLAVIPIDERIGLDATDAETAAVLRAVDWCYARASSSGEPDWVSDRLPFVQTRIAQTLEPHPEDDRLAALAHTMPFLLEGIEWQWKAFIEGKVGEYLTQVQQVETVVVDTVTSFADRAAALAKALTETILAAVAVLIGSFIAAAFRDPFNATLFRIGVRTYAAYVVLFPGVLGLLASAHSLGAAKAGFDTRIARFKETLYAGKVDEIVGSRVNTARASYWRWFAAVALIYVAVAVAAWVAADTVPRHLRHTTTSTSTTTTTTARTATTLTSVTTR